MCWMHEVAIVVGPVAFIYVQAFVRKKYCEHRCSKAG